MLETVNLMAGGLPHRMRFKNFNSRYRLLAPAQAVSRKEELAAEECSGILECLRAALAEPAEDGPAVSRDWALGRKHVFLRYPTLSPWSALDCVVLQRGDAAAAGAAAHRPAGPLRHHAAGRVAGPGRQAALA